MPFFDSVEMSAEDPILGLAAAFNQDKKSSKVNLGVGAYKNEEGAPYVLSSVREAEKIIFEQHLDKEYQPILGNNDFILASLQLVFGENSLALKKGRIAAAQSLGGTGALRIGGDFLRLNGISNTIYLSYPSWPNHKAIFSKVGMNVSAYSYYDTQNHSLHFSALVDSIKKIPPGGVILLQPCCHNPTGVDPTFQQWKELSQLLAKHQIIPFFDFAYQGFGEGLTEDAKVIRFFEDAGHEMVLSLSYSKNFGLYGERVGLLGIVCQDSEVAKKTNSQLKQIIRGSYSMPPLHGQRIVTTILKNNELRNMWTHEVNHMRNRINEMRKALFAGLSAKGKEDRFQSPSNQKGMFSFCGLNGEEVEELKKNYGIYLPADGRINVAGLNMHNIDYVIASILSVTGK